MASKKIKLTAFERQIEEEVERGEWKPVPEKEKAEMLAALRRKVESIRGGVRLGAGRKALGHIPTSLSLKPETRTYLIKAAGGSRGMGAVVDRLVAEKAKRKRSLVG